MGLRIIDITIPNVPQQVSLFASSSFRGVSISGNYAYIADYFDGLKIINISNPASPSLVVTYGLQSTAYDVAVVGNYAYVASYGRGLIICNIANPASPAIDPDN